MLLRSFPPVSDNLTVKLPAAVAWESRPRPLDTEMGTAPHRTAPESCTKARDTIVFRSIGTNL